jgi:hypothetical protein
VVKIFEATFKNTVRYGNAILLKACEDFRRTDPRIRIRANQMFGWIYVITVKVKNANEKIFLKIIVCRQQDEKFVVP